ncbi:MAG TPA: carboxy terminal-processing peptidase, partial [Desulfopila sp.]|nr:carboxy terminal-processing peptidase [Desulfopila sp.]
LYDHLKTGEQYLDYSLPWDKVAPVPYFSYAISESDVEVLKSQSTKRLEHEEGLRIIAEEALKSKERIEKTRISLKLSDMKKERDASNEARDKVGAHYRKYQDEQIDNFDAPEESQGPTDDKQEWFEELREDPYINESIRILEDILEKDLA